MLRKLVLIVLLVTVTGFNAKVFAGSSSLSVVTSFFPAYDFTRQIGGDRVDVSLLLPPGVEAHAYAPTPRDMVRINRADIFLHGGLGMEPWVDDMVQGLDLGKLVLVDTSAGFHSHHDHHPGHGEAHAHHDDPHFWLDPVKALGMVENIMEALVRLDKVNADYYRQQALILSEKIKGLDRDIKKGLADCQSHTVVSGGHFAFGHFCRRYNLQVVSAYTGFSPDAAPSPRDLARLIKYVKKTGSRAIYHEELLQPKIARIIAGETGAQLFLLHGAHNLTMDEHKQGETYLSIMEGNLRRLRQGLQCQ